MDCEPSPARVEQVGRERPAEPPCVAQGACCGDCIHFDVLDGGTFDADKWFGVCRRQTDEEFGIWATTKVLLDFVYDHGRHGCDMPETEDCFEEA